MKSLTGWIYAVTFILVALGFLLPFWPLSFVGVLVAAFSGRWIFAVLAALLVDLAWGTPTGWLAFLFFPLTFSTLVLLVARALGGRYLFDKNPQARL